MFLFFFCTLLVANFSLLGTLARPLPKGFGIIDILKKILHPMFSLYPEQPYHANHLSPGGLVGNILAWNVVTLGSILVLGLHSDSDDHYIYINGGSVSLDLSGA